MSRLLSAGFRRLWRSRVFWIKLVVMAAVPAWLCISNAGYLSDGILHEYRLEDLVFSMTPAVGFVYAVFTALFLSPEYSEGALRNKVIVGHGRTGIYLANLIVCMTASLIALTLYFLVAVGMGTAFFGGFTRDAAEIICYFVICYVAAAALSAALVLLVMCIPNKATATVMTIVGYLLLMISGSALVDRLNEPELQYGYMVMTESGKPEFHDLEKNPLHVSGNIRTVLEWLRDMNPGAQMIQVNNLQCDYPLRLPFTALLFGGAATLAGVLILKKKDIK